MNNTGLILVSHGEFAKAALASAEMIAGKQEDVMAFGLAEDTSLEWMEQKIWDAYQTLSETCSDVIILCDIYGGTPFNAISRNLLKGMNAIAYTGLSLPLVIDLCLSRTLSHDEIEERIKDTHQQACQHIVVAIQTDEDDMDL